MSEGLKSRLTTEMKTAMKAREKVRLGTIRLVLAELKQKEVDERIELSDAQITDILVKMVKQRNDSIVQYEKANRPELAAVEQAEIDIIREFLPTPLSADEIEALIVEIIAATGATSVRDMGKVMGQLKAKISGKADMGVVGARVKALLGDITSS